MNTQETGSQVVRNLDKVPGVEDADYSVTLYAGILGDAWHLNPGDHKYVQGRGQFNRSMQWGRAINATTEPYTSGGRTYLSSREKALDFWSLAAHWPSSPALRTGGTRGQHFEVGNYGFPEGCSYDKHTFCDSS